MKYVSSIIIIGLLAVACYFSFQLHSAQKQSTQYQEHFAEINKINYGLFNIQLWKDKAIDIFEDRINNFEIDPAVYGEVQKELNRYLLQVYTDYFESGRIVDEFFKQQEKSGKKINTFMLKMVKDNIGTTLKSFDIKARLPMISGQLLDELRKNEDVLKGYLRQELNQLIFEENPAQYVDPREALYKYYDTSTHEECNTFLESQITDSKSEIDRLLKLIYGLLLGALLLAAISFGINGTKVSILFFTLISIIMLGLGISLPMIDIDARLNGFSMDLLGNGIAFDEQFLYYQSKSILDVTWTLIEGRGIDLKIVGLLILLFSIVFPFFKLLLSTLFVYVEKLQSSKFVKTVIFYLGKWSMADVFVVAMFMAYIGFYGLVTSQLGDIGLNQNGFAVETLNYSRLSPGALFFTSYCVLSIVTSIIINRKYTAIAD